MNKKSPLVGCLLGIALCGSAFAQELIKLPSGNFSCDVKVTPHATPAPVAPDQSAPPPYVTKIRILRTGNVRLDTIEWSDKSSAEVWTICREGLAVTETKRKNGSKEIQVLSGTLRDAFSPRILLLTPEIFYWITKSARVAGSTGVEENPPVHYQQTIGPSPMKDAHSGQPAATSLNATRVLQAWIDPLTLLPKKLDDGAALYELSFSADVPATPLQIPANLANHLNRWMEIMTTKAALQKMPPPNRAMSRTCKLLDRGPWITFRPSSEKRRTKLPAGGLAK